MGGAWDDGEDEPVMRMMVLSAAVDMLMVVAVDWFE